MTATPSKSQSFDYIRKLLQKIVYMQMREKQNHIGIILTPEKQQIYTRGIDTRMFLEVQHL